VSRPPDLPLQKPEDEGRPPLLGTWPRVYAAVFAWAVLLIAALALFSSWSF
jgi:hypothetical protein